MNLDIFNNLAENLKNNKIVEKFIDELNKTLEKNNNGNIINNEELTTEYRDKMLLERNEILQKYADLTSEKGDMYYIYDKKDSYLATLCKPENNHEVLKLDKDVLPEDATVGSVLRLENQNYIIDYETTNLVKSELQNALNNLIEEQKLEMSAHRVEDHLYEFVEKDANTVSLIDVTKNDGVVFEDFDFSREIFKDAVEGDTFEFRDGEYKKV